LGLVSLDLNGKGGDGAAPEGAEGPLRAGCERNERADRVRAVLRRHRRVPHRLPVNAVDETENRFVIDEADVDACVALEFRPYR
jgi:hypothetical protein